MTLNALKINKLKSPDSILNTHYGQALKSYETESRNPNNLVSAGGFFWSWKKLLGRKESFALEGIWVPARMISGNLAQYVVAFYVLIGGILLTLEWNKGGFESAKTQFEDLINGGIATAISEALIDAGLIAGNELIPVFEEEDVIFEEADFEGSSNFTFGVVEQNVAPDVTSVIVQNLYPAEKYMVIVPMCIATIIGFLNAMFLALVYLASVPTTILKFRSGNIATLRDNDFNRFRSSPDQVALLSGSLFWGSFFSSIGVGGLIGLIVFFFLWQVSAYYAQRVVAMLAGIISVSLLRLALLCACRKSLWSSFYRVKPGKANISILALEWGSFALSAGSIISRGVNLLLAAFTFIGRIDTPFLAENVRQIGPVNLDNASIIQMKSLLMHEAHKHPYIEQLGLIYLMKLRYKKHFGKRAGTAWRMIFVYALMPWMHRYRIMARHDEKTGRKEENDDQNGLSVLNLKFVSLHNIDVTAGADDDVDQAQAEAMWMMKASSMPKLGDNFYKIRNQELEEEVRQLRAALAEVSSHPEHSNENVNHTEQATFQTIKDKDNSMLAKLLSEKDSQEAKFPVVVEETLQDLFNEAEVNIDDFIKAQVERLSALIIPPPNSAPEHPGPLSLVARNDGSELSMDELPASSDEHSTSSSMVTNDTTDV